MTRRVLLAATLSGFALTACVSPSQMLVGPQGDVRRCASSGWGYVGAPLAKRSYNHCVEDMEAAGYLPLEEAGVIGIQFATDPNRAVVSVVSPDSPAKAAGIQIGDEIVAVNGQRVVDRAAARTLMFGKVGGAVQLSIRRSGSTFDVGLQRGARATPAG